MSKRRDSPDLGPLPKAYRNAELQRRSIAAFHASLPTNKFVFRGEPVEDAGVDGSLELLVDGRYTNLRAQVQLKSTDSDDTNVDGSVSVQVKVSNLNYLLNGPSPIYVLYISPKEELRFAWARDERKRFDEANSHWAEQEHATIRFNTHVTPETLEQIHQRIGREARLQRKFNDILDIASNTEQVTVRINTATLAITDPEEAKALLIKSGTAIVSAGYAHQVLDLIGLLDRQSAQEPRILLIKAHAESHLERYRHAIASLADASLRTDELSDEDKLFLQILQDSCYFQTGRLSASEFSQRLEQVSRRNDKRFALSHRMQQIRHTLNEQEAPGRSAALLEELRLLVERILSSPNSSQAFKINARICWIEAEGNQLVRDSLKEIGEARIKLTVGGAPDLLGMFQSYYAKLAKWEKESSTLLEDATEFGNPYLIAEAIITRGGIRHGVLTNQKILSRMYGLPPITFPQDSIQSNIDIAQQAAEIFSQSGKLESELRAKMLIAEFYDLNGLQSKAQEIAGEVLPKAKIMEYADLIWRAEKHLSGQSLQSEFADAARPRSEREKAIDSAQRSDEELSQNAAQAMRICDLPEERLPVMEREYSSYRDIAREKLNWCRHIELIQDKRHWLDPATFYRTDPTRFCLCRLHGYRSKFGHTDWEKVISAFKKSYCEGCMDRTPFNKSSS